MKFRLLHIAPQNMKKEQKKFYDLVTHEEDVDKDATIFIYLPLIDKKSKNHDCSLYVIYAPKESNFSVGEMFSLERSNLWVRI